MNGIFKPLADYGITASGTDLGIDSTSVVTDTYTGVSGTFMPMQVLVHRRDLYNDEENPLYSEDVTPLLGPNGSVENLNTEVTGIYNALSHQGWYTQYIKNWTYPNPFDLLIYYGWLSGFNYSENAWSNEKVAQDLARYNYIVLGNGIASTGHGDYANTSVIIPRVQGLNQHVKIFGYVTVAQDLADFKTHVDEWEALGVDGIFMDEAGYDYGKTRQEFNERVDYVHSQTNAKVCFANAWNLDHILGIENDTSYPNSTYNTVSGTSNLTDTDWCLLESYAVNTASYSANGGYESKSDWQQRGLQAINKRYEYGINIAASSVINNSNADAQELFNFGFVSAMMWNFEAYGSSDTLYGASSSTVTYWKRPRTEGLGREWALSPAVQVDYNDVDVYHRFLDFGKLTLDFSTGAHKADIEKFTEPDSFILRFNAGDLTEGQTNYPSKTTASGNPVTGLGYDDTIEESMYDAFQIPRHWKDGTDVEIKMHFFNEYTQTGDKACKWALDYQIYDEGDDISSKVTTTISVEKTLPTDVSADTFHIATLNMSANDTNNPITRNKTLTFRVYRDATDSADNMEYDAVLILLTFEFRTEVI